MAVSVSAPWLLEQEARALLTRLDRVKPFALEETMVPAAGLLPASQAAIELYLLRGRRQLRGQVLGYIRWVRGPGRSASPAELQRRFSFLRLRFNAALSQLDLFAEAISQRSEHETGVWLSGLDVAAQDALALPGPYLTPPPIICYLHRGLGGAIRRARTRLPGGGQSPAAVIRIPRERMIGYGIGSSLVHEVGHQGAALLGLVESLRPTLQHLQRVGAAGERTAWRLWERWISEVIADFWAVSKIGIASTLGLMGIVSLPRWFVFRVNIDDPHPFPWIRVHLSCAIGDSLYPDRQWRRLAAAWSAMYPPDPIDAGRRAVIAGLLATVPMFVAALAHHRPSTLGGRSLGQVLATRDRAPRRLLALWDNWQSDPAGMRAAPPTLAFAVFGQARASGRLTPEGEDRLLGKLITHWALRSTLEAAETCAQIQPPKPASRPAATTGRPTPQPAVPTSAVS